MTIRMYHSDHQPPHFHVQYGDQNVIIEIESGRLLAGRLHTRLLRAVQEWRRARKNDLLKLWNDAQKFRVLRRLKPL